jgi:flagellar hook-length control protein FliK
VVTSLKDQNEKVEEKNPMKASDTDTKAKGEEERKEANEISKNDSGSKTVVSSKVEVKPAVVEKNLNDIYLKIREMAKTEISQTRPIETATIRLTPPSLGKVELEIVKDAMKITVFMKVESLEAKEMLEKNSNLLAIKLGNSGFDVQKINIQVNKEEDRQNQEQGQNNKNNQNSNSSGQGQKDEKENNGENLENFEMSFADILRGGSENDI